MAPKKPILQIRIGTRSSRLALAQSHWVGRRIEERYPGEVAVDYVLISTKGDKLRHLSLAKLDDKGFFTREIESALLENAVDIAVHSYKDMPTQGPEGLQIGALVWREDPADLLLIRPEAYDPEAPHFPVRENATVGTGSIRRQLQLLEQREDLLVKDLRGNVNTRLEKAQTGQFDAILLAAAGVARLGLDTGDLVVHRLEPSSFVPAPGQGVVAVQMREDDAKVRRVLEGIHAPEVDYVVKSERTFLAMAEGGCNLPLGAWAESLDSGEIQLHTVIGAKGWVPGGDVDIERVTVVGEDPEELAWTAIQIHKDRRGGTVWGGTADTESNQGAGRVLVTSSESVGRGQMQALRSAGFGVVHVPMIETESTVGLEALQDVASSLSDGDWIVFASSAAVRHFLERLSLAMLPPGLKIAAIGAATASSVQSFGLTPDFVPVNANSESFVEEFPPCNAREPKGRFLLPTALEGRRVIAEALRHQGHDVQVFPVYRTRPAEGEAVQAALAVDYDAVIFSSPSGVQTFQRIRPDFPLRCVAIGPTTKASLEEAGVGEIFLANNPSPTAIVQCLKDALS